MLPNRTVRPEIMDSVALLVVDAQSSFIDTLPHKDRFLSRCAFAIEAAKQLQLRIVFMEQAPDKLGKTHSDLRKLAPDAKVFPKTAFSALAAPGIERYLRDNEIYHLLVVGLETPICLYQTGLQASEEDVDLTFLSDAIASRREADESTALQALIRLGCQVLPAETVFYSLIGDVQSPYFRGFNQLVKTFNQPELSLDTYKAAQPERSERPATAKRIEREAPKQQRPERLERETTPAPAKVHLPETATANPPTTLSESGEPNGERRGRRRRRRGGRGRSREDQENAAAEKVAPNTNSESSDTPAPRTENAPRKSDQRSPRPGGRRHDGRPDRQQERRREPHAEQAAPPAADRRTLSKPERGEPTETATPPKPMIARSRQREYIQAESEPAPKAPPAAKPHEEAAPTTAAKKTAKKAVKKAATKAAAKKSPAKKAAKKAARKTAVE